VDLLPSTVADRSLLTVTNHVYAAGLGEFLGTALTRFRSAAPPAPLPWPDNCPFVIYYGEVSADGDGPVQLCRPIGADPDSAAQAAAATGATVRQELSHEEIYLRLPRADAGDPRLLESYATLERWYTEHQRAPAAAPRQVLIADWRTAGPDEPAFDLAVPLR
jgi:hypothetical protein